jgi:hypothetical protein
MELKPGCPSVHAGALDLPAVSGVTRATKDYESVQGEIASRGLSIGMGQKAGWIVYATIFTFGVCERQPNPVVLQSLSKRRPTNVTILVLAGTLWYCKD